MEWWLSLSCFAMRNLIECEAKNTHLVVFFAHYSLLSESILVTLR